jgi:MFS family permease
MDQAGAIVGPITAFVLLQVIDIRGIFLFSLIPGAIAVTILIFAIKEVAIKRLSKTATIFSNFGKVLRGNRSFVILLIITGAFSLGAYNYSFVLLRASNLGISKDMIPLVYAVINISYTLVSTPTGLVADKIGKEKVLMVGYVVFAVSSLLMILFVRNALYAFVLAAVFGIYMGISDTLQRAVIPRYTSADLRGTAYGIYNIIVGVGFFVSNIVFGYLWDNFSLNAAVMYSSFFTGSAIIGMAIFIKKYPYDKLQVP